MKHAAVISTLMEAHTGFLFQDRHHAVRIGLLKPVSRAETEQTSADHYKLKLRHRVTIIIL